jgi:Domain of unknown function (DUF222)/HNH endonuclease
MGNEEVHVRDPDGCSNAELIDGIGGHEVAVSGNRRAQLRFIREFDLRKGWAPDGARHMGQWLAGHLGITIAEGIRRTHAAHALEKLPLLSAALDSGQLSFEKTLQLARFITPEDQADRIKWAGRVTLNTIRREADAANRPTLDDVQAYEASRYLAMWECDEAGSLGIEGRLPAAAGALFKKAIERAAKHVPDMPDEVPDADKRNADALVMLVSGGGSDQADPDRATVVVHATLEGLRARDRNAEIESGPVIAPEAAGRLLCDSRLEVVLHDTDGRAVGIGRASRSVPGWLRRQVTHRDRGCTFPGCGTKQYTDCHHVVPWERNGPTDLSNLTLVCNFHHKLVHERSWSVRLNDSEEAEWFRPDGTRFEPKVRAREMVLRPQLLPAAGFA